MKIKICENKLNLASGGQFLIKREAFIGLECLGMFRAILKLWANKQEMPLERE